MRMLITAGAAVLLLAGCGAQDEGEQGETRAAGATSASTQPQAQTQTPAEFRNLPSDGSAICPGNADCPAGEGIREGVRITGRDYAGIILPVDLIEPGGQPENAPGPPDAATNNQNRKKQKVCGRGLKCGAGFEGRIFEKDNLIVCGPGLNCNLGQGVTFDSNKYYGWFCLKTASSCPGLPKLPEDLTGGTGTGGTGTGGTGTGTGNGTTPAS